MPGNDKFGRVFALGDSVQFYDQFQVLRGESGQLNRQVEFFDHGLQWHGTAGPWTNNRDGTGVAVAIVAGAGGVVRLDTAATSGSRDALVTGSLGWSASAGGLLLEARVSLSALTACRANIGFTDALTDGGAGKVVFEVAGSTVTANAATNAVCMVFDAAATNPNWLLVGRKASVNTAAVDSGAAASVAAAFDVIRLTVNPDGHATITVNDKTIATVPNAVTASTLLTPYLGIVNTGAASKKLDYDYVYAKCANAAGV